jgi:hypothetical protein
VLRCSDEAETALNLARPAEIGAEGAGGGCLAIVGWEGSAEDVDMRRRGATRMLEALGRGPEPDAGESWARDRYRGPYWYERELGPTAVEALRAVKTELDPAGVLNPGILIP